MATSWKKIKKWWIKAFKTPTTTEEITAIYSNQTTNQEWLAFRHQFLWQRLNLWLWLILVCLFTFTLRNIYDFFFPLAELDQIPAAIREQSLLFNAILFLLLFACFAIHKTKFGRYYPGWLFLITSWSLSLSSQIFTTLKGYSLPDPFGWALLFISQATLMPVRWYLHLCSQLGVLAYHFGMNTILKIETPLPNYPDIHNVTFGLYIFWLCAICDIGVYLYDRLQRSEFGTRQELESAYKQLKMAEVKYRSIFENAVEGIFQSSPDGRYITANLALAKIYGYSSPQEVTANFTDIGHQLYVNPQRRAEFVRLIEEKGIVADFESQIYRRDGSIVWISEKAYGVRDEQGKLLYYEGWIEDITKRKQAELALQEQLNFLQVLINTIPTPVYYKNIHGQYLGCNTAFELALGLSRDRIIAKTDYEIAPRDLAHQYHQADLELLMKKEVQSYESSMIFADGIQHDVIFYKATFSKTDGNLCGVVGVILDISDRKRTEEALRLFIHAVSHDLRNPVLGSLMVLKNLLSRPDEKISLSRSILERMVQSSDRQLNLINSLMEAHISETQGIFLQLQPVQLYDIVQGAIADLEPMLTENQATLTNLVTADLPTINADPTQLWRVFSNLIVNSLKHNPPGLLLQIKATLEEKRIYCTVSDNGVGISHEQSKRLFDLYYRGSNIRNSVSLGLGLYLCKQIIEAHGGDIGVHTAPQAGATFWFTLPITAVVNDA
ncbi:MAG TPA: PAS domain S-box protein [Nostocaceae cyanobacterium]|nr:PAS domain S-box protein [Nostocaceae cyanobacterium]